MNEKIGKKEKKLYFKENVGKSSVFKPKFLEIERFRAEIF